MVDRLVGYLTKRSTSTKHEYPQNPAPRGFVLFVKILAFAHLIDPSF